MSSRRQEVPQVIYHLIGREYGLRSGVINNVFRRTPASSGSVTAMTIISSQPLERFAEEKASLPNRNQACEASGQTRSTLLMTVSPDGTRVASGHGDHTIRISDVRTGKCLRVLNGHPRTPWCLAFHPMSSDILGSGCLGGEVRIWDLKGGGSESYRCDETLSIASLTFHPLDNVIVFAIGNRLNFWDWKKPAPFAVVQTAHNFEKIRWVKFDPLGQYLYTGIANSSFLDLGGSVESEERVTSLPDVYSRETSRALDSLRTRYHPQSGPLRDDTRMLSNSRDPLLSNWSSDGLNEGRLSGLDWNSGGAARTSWLEARRDERRRRLEQSRATAFEHWRSTEYRNTWLRHRLDHDRDSERSINDARFESTGSSRFTRAAPVERALIDVSDYRSLIRARRYAAEVTNEALAEASATLASISASAATRHRPSSELNVENHRRDERHSDFDSHSSIPNTDRDVSIQGNDNQASGRILRNDQTGDIPRNVIRQSSSTLSSCRHLEADSRERTLGNFNAYDSSDPRIGRSGSLTRGLESSLSGGGNSTLSAGTGRRPYWRLRAIYDSTLRPPPAHANEPLRRHLSRLPSVTHTSDVAEESEPCEEISIVVPSDVYNSASTSLADVPSSTEVQPRRASEELEAGEMLLALGETSSSRRVLLESDDEIERSISVLPNAVVQSEDVLAVNTEHIDESGRDFQHISTDELPGNVVSTAGSDRSLHDEQHEQHMSSDITIASSHSRTQDGHLNNNATVVLDDDDDDAASSQNHVAGPDVVSVGNPDPSIISSNFDQASSTNNLELTSSSDYNDRDSFTQDSIASGPPTELYADLDETSRSHLSNIGSDRPPSYSSLFGERAGSANADPFSFSVFGERRGGSPVDESRFERSTFDRFESAESLATGDLLYLTFGDPITLHRNEMDRMSIDNSTDSPNSVSDVISAEPGTDMPSERNRSNTTSNERFEQVEHLTAPLLNPDVVPAVSEHETVLLHDYNAATVTALTARSAAPRRTDAEQNCASNPSISSATRASDPSSPRESPFVGCSSNFNWSSGSYPGQNARSRESLSSPHDCQLPLSASAVVAVNSTQQQSNESSPGRFASSGISGGVARWSETLMHDERRMRLAQRARHSRRGSWSSTAASFHDECHQQPAPIPPSSSDVTSQSLDGEHEIASHGADAVNTSNSIPSGMPVRSAAIDDAQLNFFDILSRDVRINAGSRLVTSGSRHEPSSVGQSESCDISSSETRRPPDVDRGVLLHTNTSIGARGSSNENVNSQSSHQLSVNTAALSNPGFDSAEINPFLRDGGVGVGMTGRRPVIIRPNRWTSAGRGSGATPTHSDGSDSAGLTGSSGNHSAIGLSARLREFRSTVSSLSALSRRLASGRNSEHVFQTERSDSSSVRRNPQPEGEETAQQNRVVENETEEPLNTATNPLMERLRERQDRIRFHLNELRTRFGGESVAQAHDETSDGSGSRDEEDEDEEDDDAGAWRTGRVRSPLEQVRSPPEDSRNLRNGADNEESLGQDDRSRIVSRLRNFREDIRQMRLEMRRRHRERLPDNRRTDDNRDDANPEPSAATAHSTLSRFSQYRGLTQQAVPPVTGNDSPVTRRVRLGPRAWSGFNDNAHDVEVNADDDTRIRRGSLSRQFPVATNRPTTTRALSFFSDESDEPQPFSFFRRLPSARSWQARRHLLPPDEPDDVSDLSSWFNESFRRTDDDEEDEYESISRELRRRLERRRAMRQEEEDWTVRDPVRRPWHDSAQVPPFRSGVRYGRGGVLPGMDTPWSPPEAGNRRRMLQRAWGGEDTGVDNDYWTGYRRDTPAAGRALGSEVDRQNERLQAAINRAISGAFTANGESSIASNITDQTYRIQAWDFKHCLPPDVMDSEANIVVRRAKLHNDASCDISQDGRLLCVFLQYTRGFSGDIRLGVFSLVRSSRGQCLFTKTFGPNAVSVSISPRNHYVLVGLASKKFTWIFSPKQMIAQVFQLKSVQPDDDSMEHVCDIMHPCDVDIRAPTSLNSARWLAGPGDGLVYGTNRGDLNIYRPGFDQLVKPDASADEDADLPGGSNPVRNNLMQILGLAAPRTVNTSTQTGGGGGGAGGSGLNVRRPASTQTDASGRQRSN